MKILTFNAGLIRITPVDVLMLKWNRTWEEAARGLPELVKAMSGDNRFLSPLAHAARLVNLPLWSMAAWIDERAQALPGVLRTCGADVICLQEVFEEAHREHLLHAVQDVYPYHAMNIDPVRFGVSDGLMILSKHPIGYAHFTSFQHAPWEEGLLVNRGSLMARIDSPTLDPIMVVNSHPTAAVAFRDTFGAVAAEHRMKQLKELVALTHSIPIQERVILAGDMNCGPIHGAAEYEFLISSGFKDAFLAAPERPPEEAQDTFDTVHNPLNLNCQPEKVPPERIDHILLPETSVFTSKYADILFKDPIVQVQTAERMPVSDHYGVMVELDT